MLKIKVTYKSGLTCLSIIPGDMSVIEFKELMTILNDEIVGIQFL